MRMITVKPPTADEWWEWGPLYHGVNVGKRAVTLDLTRAEGLAALERLLDDADVFIENFTPRVMDNFGLAWERVHERHPRLLMVRMPAFGLDGPWRDRTGFAQTMEAVSGMAWVTGEPDGPPILVRGACDPLAGAHAALAVLVALATRENDGDGHLVEVPMVEAALNVAAEQVIEFDAAGTLLSRTGNRLDGFAPQGVYRGAGEDNWIAISVATDEQWRALRAAIGNPSWAADETLASAAEREAAHDAIDHGLAAWFAARDVARAVELLTAAGVPAGVVVAARDIAHNPQLQARGLFEPEDHRVTGRHDIPGLPVRFSRVDRWARGAAPTLGEHNDEVLGAALGKDALDELRAAGVAGETLAGA
jgi:crotonobetainyl-CoA:carnitine CoA-transferase CaiB-like acyl-CoA transferase